MSSQMVADMIGLLNDDLVSHGLFVQQLEDNKYGEWTTALAELLARDIEIGDAKSTGRDYVEFIAWNGPIAARVERAQERVANSLDSEREFAYWLCLRGNVDRYEPTEKVLE